jgi:hypothetical protein
MAVQVVREKPEDCEFNVRHPLEPRGFREFSRYSFSLLA